MRKWEYKVTKGWPMESELNRLGAEGWELVAIGVAGTDTKGIDTVCAYFKRPISN
jgi:hypothetical protein